MMEAVDIPSYQLNEFVNILNKKKKINVYNYFKIMIDNK